MNTARRVKYATDPAYRERIRAYNREHYAKRRNNAAWVAKENKRKVLQRRRRYAASVPAPGLTHVYVFTAGPYAKIGTARSVFTRRATVSGGCPLPVVIAFASASMPKDKAREIERRAHTKLNSHRANGEWFKVSGKRATNVVKACS